MRSLRELEADAPATRAPKRSLEASLRAVLQRVAGAPSELRDILAGDEAALVAFTSARRIVVANAPAERLLGYDRGALDGRPVDDIVPERLRQPDPPPMVAQSDLMSVDLAGLMRDGSERPLEWTFGSAPTPDGPIFVMVLRDRGELDDADEALRASEERFRYLVNGIREHAIFMLDAGGLVATWNEGAERMKGWSEADVLGRHFGVFSRAADNEAEEPARLLATAAAEGVAEARGWRRRKDGTEFFAESSISRLRGRDGALRGYVVVTQDLTTRIRAEENERRLHEEEIARKAAQAAEARALVSEERLRRLYRVNKVLVNATTPSEVAAVALKACLEEVGASGGGFYMLATDGTMLELLDTSGLSPDVVAPFQRLPLESRTPITDVARSGIPSFWEKREDWLSHYPELRGALRNDRSFEASAALPLTVQGTLVGVLGLQYEAVRTFDDEERSLFFTIAELCSQALDRARLFAAEQRAREAAESANRTKDEFLAMLGHELRNPLAPITTALSLMRARGAAPDREREVIERQVRQMTKLVDDLLDVARIARGTVELSRETVTVLDVVERAIEMASPLIEQRRHSLDLRVPPEPVHVHGDPGRLAQVIANLLNNAAKYTPAGGRIELVVSRSDREASIRVIDNGEGLAEDLVARVFDVFVQGHRTLARSEGGLGLGLALVKNIVAMHGGTVTAASAGPGRGSTFTVRLATALAPPARASTPPRAVRTPPPKRSRRILVVDDNQDAAELLGLSLEREGYEVAIAFDAPSALERLEQFGADVAILDIGLPVIDGFELARRIRALHGNRAMRLLALTGYGRANDIAKSEAAGFDTHLTKPVDVSSIVSAIEAPDRTSD